MAIQFYMMSFFKPSDYQPALNPESFIIQTEESPSEDSLSLDALFIGAGPASLAGAIHLADLAKSRNLDIQIGIMEKAEQVGGHSLSGAVVNPLVFHWLFPDKTAEELPFRKKVTKEAFYYLSKNRAFPLPVPPGMRGKNYWTASLCEIVRFLGKEAAQRGVHIFTSFPAEKLLARKGKIIGALSKAYGLNKDGAKEPNAEPAEKIFAKVVALSEGSRGHLSQSYCLWKNIQSQYPQTYALGVKEIWEVKAEPEGHIFHSIGWPLNSKTFGGSWFYSLGGGLVSLGLAAGLDSPSGDLSTHDELQKMKSHPLFKKYLKGGKCVEWGAKTIPEGGYYAWPDKLHGDGALILGDSAGFVNMASLKGIHYAMASGYYAAEAILKSFEKQDFSARCLKEYDEKIKNSFIAKDLYIYRNLRQSFHKGLLSGLLKAGLLTLTRGLWPFDFKKSLLTEDAQVKRQIKWDLAPGGESRKADAVYLSGNQTRDKVPSHLMAGKNISKELGKFYERMCPAGVYEQKEKLLVSAPNCIDCKATDVLGPRWTPRERGSGPNYKLM